VRALFAQGATAALSVSLGVSAAAGIVSLIATYTAIFLIPASSQVFPCTVHG
jgi:hypothetical protein